MDNKIMVSGISSCTVNTEGNENLADKKEGKSYREKGNGKL